MDYEQMKYEQIGEAFPNYLIVVGVFQMAYHAIGVQVRFLLLQTFIEIDSLKNGRRVILN